eukprot:TRINITY_DN2172_c0_g1_i4.p1 TRINITY_DN2172_c0_g1~~TRINITY_DN2172_c0_g1_i4.p1  ORF type:complete len:810 (+),score=250.26 TRINITY_DN2172_c0_g1_i4:39-2432(+)
MFGKGHDGKGRGGYASGRGGKGFKGKGGKSDHNGGGKGKIEPLKSFEADGMSFDSSGWQTGTVFSLKYSKYFKAYVGVNVYLDKPLFVPPGLCTKEYFVSDSIIECNFNYGPRYVTNTLLPAIGERVKCTVALTKNDKGEHKFVAQEWCGEGGAKLKCEPPPPKREPNMSVCMRYLSKSCPMQDKDRCAAGVHSQDIPPAPHPTKLFRRVDGNLLKYLRKQWEEASGGGVSTMTIVAAWQVTNERLDATYRITEGNMRKKHGKFPDRITGYHGTPEENILMIATDGFDPSKRKRSAHGEGEYFAKNPGVSVGYCNHGSFMFQCDLILGEEGDDHTWQGTSKYYILKQHEGNNQAMPRFLLQFVNKAPTNTELGEALAAAASGTDHVEDHMRRKLAVQQVGGTSASKARWWCGMSEASTKYLWVGWLDPLLREDSQVEAAVRKFLWDCKVKEVTAVRNAARVGARVELLEPIDKVKFAKLAERLYEGVHITVDDGQVVNGVWTNRDCLRLTTNQHACRSWNLRGHYSWMHGCPMRHRPEMLWNAQSTVEYEELREGGAKFDEISAQILSDPDLKGLGIEIKRIRKITNSRQEQGYIDRKVFLTDKYGCVVERELWHGTCCSALDDILTKGLQCPSDCKASKECPVSGGKGMRTTLCGTDCKYCTEKHEWDKCHMFGLGIYFADIPMKSHRYVTGVGADGVHTLLRCKVNLGNPYYIEGNLKEKDAMHNIVDCDDPSKYFDRPQDPWNTATGHGSYVVKGLKGSTAFKKGFGVLNTEYIIFHPLQVVPLYAVDYVVRRG